MILFLHVKWWINVNKSQYFVFIYYYSMVLFKCPYQDGNKLHAITNKWRLIAGKIKMLNHTRRMHWNLLNLIFLLSIKSGASVAVAVIR